MTETQEIDGLLTIAEAASVLRVSRRTVERYIQSGSLRSSKLPGGAVRISRVEISSLLSVAPSSPEADGSAARPA